MNEPHLNDPARAARRLGWALAGGSVTLLVLDLWVHDLSEFHPHFPCESWLGFYGWLSLGSAVSLVAVARLWRPLVRRPEDYYDE